VTLQYLALPSGVVMPWLGSTVQLNTLVRYRGQLYRCSRFATRRINRGSVYCAILVGPIEPVRVSETQQANGQLALEVGAQ
jgi:hypothetical protein